MDDEIIPECNDCHEAMRREFSTPTVNLVGGGFYRNGG